MKQYYFLTCRAVMATGFLSLTSLAFGQAEIAEPVTGEGMTLWGLMWAGGVIMIPIIFLSFIALALVLYLFFVLRRGRVLPRDMIRQAWLLMSEGKFREAHAYCVRSGSPAGRLIATAIARAGHDPKSLSAALEVAGEKEAERMTDGMMYLANIATITPMLGLLGTVLGMITTFNTIVRNASFIKPWDLAGGISQALVTTAAGLIVAIPTMAMYYYFRGRGTRMVTDLEELSEELVEKLSRVRPASSASSTPSGYQERAR